MSVNKAILVGRVGQDPEVRQAGNESVCNFSIATNETWKDKTTGERKERVEWHRITAWGRQAEIVGEYVRKGSLLYIEGKIESRRYTDKDGVEKVSVEIRMGEMKMLGGRESGETQAPAKQAPREEAARVAKQAAPSSGFDDMGDDIPF